MLDMLAKSVERGIRIFSEMFAAPVHSYCRLETAEGNTLVADDGSLISLLYLEGSLKQVGAEEFKHIVSGLTEKLQSSFSKRGHVMQVVFEFDPESSSERIDELLNPSVLTAKNLDLDIAELQSNWADSLKDYCSTEKCWLVLWTRPHVLPPSIQKTALKENFKALSDMPSPWGCQQVNRAIKALHDAHNGFVSGVLDAFTQLDLLAYPLSAHEALQNIRASIDPEFTSRNWRPLIAGDPLPLRFPESDAKAKEALQNVIYPDFKTQLWPREGHITSRNTIKIGDRLYAPLVMTLMPQTPKPFQELFRILARKHNRIPYRISFLIEDGGLDMGIKPFLSSVLSFASRDNKRFNTAIRKLREMNLSGTCCVKFRICLCTWAVIEDSEEKAFQLVKQRMAELSKTVQGWGTADVTEAVGDPLLGVTATIPAMMPTSPAPITAAPLQEALGMLPLRPASPWKDGNLLLRTQDGKIIPFAPNSCEQAAWIDLGVAPMGGGKSVFLNAMNFAFATQAGLEKLGRIVIIDIGPSSSGVITLLRENLPEHKKYLATYHRLRMTPEYSINPFDTPLGCRTPLPSHKSFLVNFLSLLATPLNANAPEKGTAELLGRAIDLAYDIHAPKHKPKLYEKYVYPHIDAIMENENFDLGAKPTWWHVVDTLFKHGYIHEAIQAQRRAVPLLGDITTQIKSNTGIANTYGSKVVNNVWQAIIDAGNSYKILSEPTQFDLGDAHVISLNLEEIAPRGGVVADRTCATSYMLAMHLAKSLFSDTQEDVFLMPELYHTYHIARAEALREAPKRICYDEAHRVTNNPSVANQLQADMATMARESRKWNLSLGLYTQSIDDIPDIICELATTVTILGAGTQQGIASLQKRFGLNEACTHALSHLGKPSRAGANFVGLFRTGAGLSQLVLTMTIGAQSLWAFSSTSEDMAIRNNLYQRMTPSETLRKLALKFPSGSAKSEVERRRRLITEHSSSDERITNVIREIADEVYAA